MGDNLEILYDHGKILIEKIDENWENIMKEIKGAWRKHPILKDMDYAVEAVKPMIANLNKEFFIALYLNTKKMAY